MATTIAELEDHIDEFVAHMEELNSDMRIESIKVVVEDDGFRFHFSISTIGGHYETDTESKG